MAQETTCSACGRDLGPSSGFRFVVGGGEAVLKCGRCAPWHRPLLRKALATSLVVGTILTAINQGDALITGPPTLAMLWKIPLTYFVPYAVSTYSALAISRVPRPDRPSRAGTPARRS